MTSDSTVTKLRRNIKQTYDISKNWTKNFMKSKHSNIKNYESDAQSK